jgi:hypothetical protein
MPKRLSFSTSPIGRHLKVPKLEIKENKIMSKVNIYIYITQLYITQSVYLITWLVCLLEN